MISTLRWSDRQKYVYQHHRQAANYRHKGTAEDEYIVNTLSFCCIGEGIIGNNRHRLFFRRTP
jgi:hypothetical protein